MSSGAWLQPSRSRGVSKHKVTLNVAKHRISTRNRSKVERLREYLNDLHLEEIERVATGHKACGNASRLKVELHDIQETQFQESSTATGISVLNNDPIVGAKPVITRRASEKHTQTCISSSDEHPSDTSLPFSCREKGNHFLSSLSSDLMGRPKRECDRPILNAFVSLKDFNRTRIQCICDNSGKSFEVFDSDNDNVDSICDNDDENPMDSDQCSPSPSNSPLYDMPPPSTPAQKQERRKKRILQLERWRKYEASKSRQERYQRRMQESAKTVLQNLAQDPKCVKWSINLVQTVYIDDTRD